jgi:hypothetical protein
MKPILVAALAATCVSAAGCASIIKGGAQEIPVSSSPSEATITVRNAAGDVVYSGVTPATVTLKKKSAYFAGHNYAVTIEKAGYAPQTVNLERGVAAWYVGGNLGFGGLLGWLVVDPLTGAMWTYRPKDISAALASQVSFDDGVLHVVLLDDVPQEARDDLAPIGDGF